MISFWEKNSLLDYDIMFIGGGITGLSAAASLKEKESSLQVAILERGVLPTGASTKNAGFACFGSLSELAEDYKTDGKDAMLQLVNKRWQGLQKLKARLTDEDIGYENFGGYEIIRKADVPLLDKLEPINDSLRQLFKRDVFELKDDQITNLGLSKTEVTHLVYNPFEGQLDTGRMMKSLMSYCRQLEIDVLTGANVSSLQESGKKVVVSLGDPLQFSAKKVIIATNAFTPDLFPSVDIKPGRGIVLITHPIKGLKLKGTFHLDKGYFYFRNYQNRVILGGGRNLDFSTETTDKFAINHLILDYLKALLKNLILPDVPHEIDHHWAGIMAFGAQKEPLVKQFSEKIIMGVRMGGMGVAIGSMIGEELAEICLQEF